ncbi:MAG: dihydrofolate reductase [Bacteroidales bacterium]|nr:dihydrofolate reductase [Bacteroidales bacterium]
MRRIVLFIATSLDGYIAGKDGNTDWLFTEGDYGYKDFYKSIDTTLMGHNTFEYITQFGRFPYSNKENYVFSRKKRDPGIFPVEFVFGDVAEFTEKLKARKGKNIWLVGGGQINSILLNANLIDRMIISIHPVALGQGIPLFKDESLKKLQFNLVKHEVFKKGLVQLTYDNS